MQKYHSSHILGARARHIDPGLGEEGARAEHENDVGERMHWILVDRRQTLRRRQIVAEAASRIRSIAVGVRPCAEEADENVAAELRRQHLSRQFLCILA